MHIILFYNIPDNVENAISHIIKYVRRIKSGK